MNFEVRQGTLSMRLLRPMHPVVSYAASNIAAMPMRMIVAMPVVGLLAIYGATRDLPTDPLLWAIWVFSLLGGWLVTFLAQVAIGSLSLFMESSVKIMDLWLALFFVFSGYLYPLEFFPPAIRAVAEWLPACATCNSASSGNRWHSRAHSFTIARNSAVLPLIRPASA
jgi:ABC-2 type transport system permease protein